MKGRTSKVKSEKKHQKSKKEAVASKGIQSTKVDAPKVTKKVVAKSVEKKKFKATESKQTKAIKEEAAVPQKKKLANVQSSEEVVDVAKATKGEVTETINIKPAPNILRDAKLIIEPSKRKKIRKTKVIMEGDLNINNVDSFVQQVLPLFDNYDFVDFFLREVSSLDLCYIQMLYHFQVDQGKKGKTVTIDADLSTDFKKVIVNTGLKELMFIPKLV